MLETDSTIAPPQNQVFSLTGVSWLLDTKEGAIKQIFQHVFLLAKDYRTMRSGWVARGTVFQETRPRAGFKTSDFSKEKLGGLP